MQAPTRLALPSSKVVAKGTRPIRSCLSSKKSAANGRLHATASRQPILRSKKTSDKSTGMTWNFEMGSEARKISWKSTDKMDMVGNGRLGAGHDLYASKADDQSSLATNNALSFQWCRLQHVSMMYVANDKASSNFVPDQPVLEGSRVLAKGAECVVLAIIATKFWPDQEGFVICLDVGYGQADASWRLECSRSTSSNEVWSRILLTYLLTYFMLAMVGLG